MLNLERSLVSEVDLDALRRVYVQSTNATSYMINIDYCEHNGRVKHYFLLKWLNMLDFCEAKIYRGTELVDRIKHKGIMPFSIYFFPEDRLRVETVPKRARWVATVIVIRPVGTEEELVVEPETLKELDKI